MSEYINTAFLLVIASALLYMALTATEACNSCVVLEIEGTNHKVIYSGQQSGGDRLGNTQPDNVRENEPVSQLIHKEAEALIEEMIDAQAGGR